mmetsp:Transcript_39370/g.103866  ORF Transcript_39370/g.103866 Transcript_39370/m.103866 type:complete len:250 (-) Transcript_39370:35-784(-)|eukprot:CAMPEP_0115831240 /NCGR_PEP_ID=MMETSP0287-20121206/2035_1 /TAXON_ID=412157 /ORGANISM="Chrysochromulina rotalis, Strain UIO044" /LENGTH=249 /DNA_ID=CAMNT_0003284577 /DNA_START=160 /DNA_END=909 /DNA_ORIENTATION=-
MQRYAPCLALSHKFYPGVRPRLPAQRIGDSIDRHKASWRVQLRLCHTRVVDTRPGRRRLCTCCRHERPNAVTIFVILGAAERYSQALQQAFGRPTKYKCREDHDQHGHCAYEMGVWPDHLTRQCDGDGAAQSAIEDDYSEVERHLSLCDQIANAEQCKDLNQPCEQAQRHHARKCPEFVAEAVALAIVICLHPRNLQDECEANKQIDRGVADATEQLDDVLHVHLRGEREVGLGESLHRDAAEHRRDDA